jgi:hypothetical protein
MLRPAVFEPDNGLQTNLKPLLVERAGEQCNLIAQLRSDRGRSRLVRWLNKRGSERGDGRQILTPGR